MNSEAARMNNKYQEALTRLTFQIMHASMALYGKFNIPVISTTRPLRFYRRALFDNQSKQQLHKDLQGKVLVDVGCGLTPFIEDSMFQWCRRHGIDFYGVDPKVKDGFKFGVFDRLKSMATGARTIPNPAIAGLDKTIATYANELPFEDQSVDIILSCWLVLSWIHDDDLLHNIFQEFDRILKPGGSIRIFPTGSVAQLQQKYPQLWQILKHYQIEQRFMVSADIGSVPPAYTTRFSKPA